MKTRDNLTTALRVVGRRLSAAGWCVFIISFLLLQVSCSLVEEDRSDCDNEASLNYDLQLVTNMTTELETELTTQTDLSVAKALRTFLADIFTDFAHDVDLSFYDTEGDSLRLHHDKHIMDANQASYTLYLPMRHYMHLAAANIVNNDVVTLADDERCRPSKLLQVNRDTIDSHTTGLFTARLPMNVVEGMSQHFDVHLYIANCAAALVIDPRGQELRNIRVFSTGFGTGFNICDSTFIYKERAPVVRTVPITDGEDGGKLCFCSVTFPSKELPGSGTRTIIETLEPFLCQPGEQPLWEFHVYVTLADGSVTKTVLAVREPLRAGQLKIINGWAAENGVIVTRNSEVATSVTLKWKEGLEIEY